ncbi:methyltransferase [Streptomyces parvus]|nr:methyltransferase [Streptomyces parvus]
MDVLKSLPRRDQLRWGACCLRGLMPDGRRKSIQLSPPCRIRQLTSACHKINYQTGYRVLPVANHQDETRTAYDGVVELYASLFADRLETQPFSRAMIGTFAELVRATGNPRAADVGCGPGHLTAMLHELGLDAFGLDLAPGMVDHARRAHPALSFQEARMESLPIENGALGGVLAHYSMIHTPPRELPELLAEQARVLAPNGLLLVSFFGTDGQEPVRFNHKVAPAYSWPADSLAELLGDAGLDPFARLLHDPASERGFLDAHLLARRP